jgi:hypothetical protein
VNVVSLFPARAVEAPLASALPRVHREDHGEPRESGRHRPTIVQRKGWPRATRESDEQARGTSRSAPGARVDSAVPYRFGHAVQSERSLPLNDRRVAATVSANSVDGTLVLVVRPVGGVERIDGVQGLLAISMWREGDETVRMSVRSATSETIAYVQGGSSLIVLAGELGLVAG